MAKQRLFVIEKHSQQQLLAPHIHGVYPDDDIRFISILSFGIHRFDYPRGLKIHEFPFVGVPQLKEGGQADLLTKETMKQMLREADEIVFACSLHHSTVVAFYFLLVSFLGIEEAQKEYRAMKIIALSPSALGDALINMGTTSDDWFTKELRYGVAKRYFEYNFHVNSLTLFGSVLRRLGIDTHKYTMSKNTLQLLYFISKQEEALTFDQLLHAMSHWKGTGKYTSDQRPLLSLGSPASQSTMIQSLSDNDLIIESEGKYSISIVGQQFLRLLHPECYDQDLPYRLHQWCNEWDESKPKIDRYLKTFFGRQKRFFQKILQFK